MANEANVRDIVDRLERLSNQDLERINWAVIREGGRRGWLMVNVEPVDDMKNGQTVRTARLVLPAFSPSLS